MAIQTRKIFIDSSVFISFIDRADNNHSKASKTIENLARLEYQLYTSYHNIVDVFAYISREMSSSIALEFLQSSLQSDMEILFPQKADLITAHRMLRANRDRQITLREALNATLMQKRNITQVLSFTYWHNLFGTHLANIIS